MSTYYASIENLKYIAEARTFYITDSELKSFGILNGLKKEDCLIIHGIKETVKFEHHLDISPVIRVYAPKEKINSIYRLVVDCSK